MITAYMDLHLQNTRCYIAPPQFILLRSCGLQSWRRDELNKTPALLIG